MNIINEWRLREIYDLGNNPLHTSSIFDILFIGYDICLILYLRHN